MRYKICKVKFQPCWNVYLGKAAEEFCNMKINDMLQIKFDSEKKIITIRKI